MRQNLSRLTESLGASIEQLAVMQQVHGDLVLEATASGEGAAADGLVTSARGLVLGVKTADCLPILIECRTTGMVAAVHAGWRGVIAEIVVRAVERLLAKGSSLGALRVALGPAIGRCCFEVDGDLPERFERHFGTEVVHVVPGKTKVHLDLALAVRRSLERAGLPPTHVDTLPHCTSCDSRFFSFRRDRGVTGRHLSVIQCATRL